MANQSRRTLDLDLLRSFLGVLDAGGFTAAARVLNTTQSTVSMQIRRLEAQLSAPLLRRLGRRVEPTPEGVRLQAHARHLLALNDLAWSEVTGPALSGRVRLGVPDDYAFYLPEIIRTFREQYPSVDLEMICDLSVALTQRLDEGQLDLALVTRQPRSPGGEVLRREPLVWVGAPGHAVEHEPTLPLSLFPRDACVFRERALAALTEADRRWRVLHQHEPDWAAGDRRCRPCGDGADPQRGQPGPAGAGGRWRRRLATAAVGRDRAAAPPGPAVGGGAPPVRHDS